MTLEINDILVHKQQKVTVLTFIRKQYYKLTVNSKMFGVMAKIGVLHFHNKIIGNALLYLSQKLRQNRTYDVILSVFLEVLKCGM